MGRINLARDGLIALAPEWFGPRWFLVDAIGIAGTIAILSPAPARRAPADADARGVPAVLRLRLDLGHLIGDFSPRQEMAFWPTLFLFGYAVAGLWFGSAFTAIGLGLTALILAAFLWSGEAFPLWLALVTGGGFILCGLWMRRA